jgi:hypothetical protein
MTKQDFRPTVAGQLNSKCLLSLETIENSFSNAAQVKLSRKVQWLERQMTKRRAPKTDFVV